MEESDAGRDQVDQGSDAEGELIRGYERDQSTHVESRAWEQVLVFLDKDGPTDTAEERQRAQDSVVELDRRRVFKHVAHPTQV
jgi:hypothetical protein